MPVTHNDPTRLAIASAVRDEIDGGASAGTLELLTDVDGLVGTLTLSYPCGSVPTDEVLTFSTLTPESAATAGTTTKFIIKSSTPTDVLYGSVGTSSTDIILNTNVILDGDTISITSLTYTAPL